MLAWMKCLYGCHASAGGMGGVLAWVSCGWGANVGGMLLLLLLLLLKYCPEEENVECLLLK